MLEDSTLGVFCHEGEHRYFFLDFRNVNERL